MSNRQNFRVASASARNECNPRLRESELLASELRAPPRVADSTLKSPLVGEQSQHPIGPHQVRRSEPHCSELAPRPQPTVPVDSGVECQRSRAPRSEGSLPSLEPTEKPRLAPSLVDHRPYSYRRNFWRACKVLILGYAIVLCFFGAPQKIFQGLYQGIVHGWDSKCPRGDWMHCGKR